MNRRTAARSIITTTLLAGLSALTTGTALAVPASGSFNPTVGFPTGNTSCVGAITAYSAHYTQDATMTPVTGVGYVIKVDATTGGPGNIGQFNKYANTQLAHGNLDSCIG